jgi:hypothetical protein
MEKQNISKIYIGKSEDYYKQKVQAEGYLSLFEGQDYTKSMVSGEYRLLYDNLTQILLHFSNKTNYVDLGPGIVDKTELILTHAKTQKQIKSYTAIDIQKNYLEIAKNKIETQLQIPTQTLETTFENGLEELRNNPNPKFIYLGATYGNFKSKQINKTLTQNMKTKDIIYLSAEKYSTNITQLIKNYSSPGVKQMTLPHLLQLGYKSDNLRFHVEFNQIQNQIEIGYIHKTLKKTEEFLVCLTSKKPTPQQFKQSLESHFKGEYIENETNIGFIGRIKT